MEAGWEKATDVSQNGRVRPRYTSRNRTQAGAKGLGNHESNSSIDLVKETQRMRLHAFTNEAAPEIGVRRSSVSFPQSLS